MNRITKLTGLIVEAHLTKIYDRYEYDAEKRAAIEVWARKLDAIIAGTKAAVRPFLQPRDEDAARAH